ncbi:MAG TPA: HdeD family acid-resistance protein [Steroidobacteraceae bacterium]|jgi:uncharacterized membrane protein HdeD (DUF308 family)
MSLRYPLHTDRFAEQLGRHWGWLLALGIVELIGGAAAIAMPLIGTLVSTFAYGWLLIIAGILYGAHAFRTRGWNGVIWHAALALLYLVIGSLLLLNPLAGAAALTLMVAVLLFVTGALQIVLASRVRPRDGWGGFVFGGVLNVALGVLLMAGWPGTALWALGILLGVNLVFSGVMHTWLALACHSGHRDDTHSMHAA